MTSRPRTLIVVFAFNEHDKLRRVVQRLLEARAALLPGCEIALMDDGSTDGVPAQLAAAHGLALVRHDENRGVGHAIRSVVQYCRTHAFEVTAWVAGNDKDEPNELGRLLAPIFDDRADLVQGSRYLPGGSFGNMPLYRQVATRFLHPPLMRLACGFPFTDSTNGFRAMRVRLFDDPRIDIGQEWLNHYEMEPYILFKAVRLGYRVVEVPVTKVYPPAADGYTKMRPFSGWWSILRPIVFLGLGMRG
jgi:dolichol-phosphate mannosyltransferase